MTEKIQLAERPVPGGFFLARKKRAPRRKPFKKKQARDTEPYTHICTWDAKPHSIRSSVLDLVRNARKKIFIASFRIGDLELIEALHQAAERLRGGIYVIGAIDERSLERGLSDLDENDSADIRIQKKDFSDLATHGIHVRGHESCHAKFMVVDDQVALVSSANLEDRALSITGENGFVVSDERQAGHLARLFARMWSNETTWEIAPRKNGVAVESRRPSAQVITVPQPGKEDGIVWTAGREHHILHAIRDTIHSAKNDLLLSSFSLNGMGRTPDLIFDPLADAISKRKLNPRCLVRVRNHFEVHRSDAMLLHEMGVKVIGDHLNHAKGVIADRRRGVLCSANFDADHGLTNGVEVGVRLSKNAGAMEVAASFFEHSMANANFEFVANPTHEQMDHHLAAGWSKKWPHSGELPVDARSRDWQIFAKLISETTSPVLFQIDEGVTTLMIGSERFEFRVAKVCSIHHVKKSTAPDSGQVLNEWLKNHGPRGNGKSVCGFCAASFLPAG